MTRSRVAEAYVFGDCKAAAPAKAPAPPHVALLGFGADEACALEKSLERLGLRAEAAPWHPADSGGEPEVERIRDIAARSGVLALRLGACPERGWAWLAGLRERAGRPVVVVAPHPDPRLRLRALRGGADDCVCAPYSPSELAMRLRAVYRRVGAGYQLLHGRIPGGAAGTVLQVGPLVMDRGARRAEVAGRPLELTAREFELLWLLASHRGRVFSRAELRRWLWHHSAAASEACVTVLMSRLRRKLAPDGAGAGLRLRARWGVGYCLEAGQPHDPGGDRAHPMTASASSG